MSTPPRMSEFTMRVRRIDAPNDVALLALVCEEAARRGMVPDDVSYVRLDAYRLDSGTHIAYAFDVIVHD